MAYEYDENTPAEKLREILDEMVEDLDLQKATVDIIGSEKNELQEEFDKIKEENEVMKEENEKLKSKVEELDKIVEASADSAKLIKEIGELKDDKKKLKKDLEDAQENEKEIIEKIKKEHEDDFKILQSTINNLNKVNKQKQDEIDQLTSKNKSLNQAIIQSEEKVAQIKNELQQASNAHNEVIQLKEELQEAYDSKEELNIEIEKLKDSQAKDKKKIRQLEKSSKDKDAKLQELDKMKKDVEATKMESASLRSELSFANAQINKEMNEKRKLNTKVTHLKHQFTALDKVYGEKLIKKDEVIERLRATVDELNSQPIATDHREIFIESKNLTKDLRASEERAERAERRIEALKQVIEKLEQENIAIRTKIQEQDDQIEYRQKLEAANAALEANNAELSSRIVREKLGAQTRSDMLKAAHADRQRILSNRVSELERIVSRSVEERETLRQSMAAAAESSAILSATCDGRERELQKAHQRIGELEAQLSASMISNSEIASPTPPSDTIKTINNVTSDMKLSEADTKINELQQRVSALENELDETKRISMSMASPISKPTQKSPKKYPSRASQKQVQETEAALKKALQALGAKAPAKAVVPELTDALVKSSIPKDTFSSFVVESLAPGQPQTPENARAAVDSARKRLEAAEKTERKYADARQVIDTLREVVAAGNDKACVGALRALFGNGSRK